jgi:uncharacterized protein YcfJ
VFRARINKSLTLPAVLLGVLMPVWASAATTYDRAEVVNVEPLYETVHTEVPREQCQMERVPVRHQARRSATGPILGAIIGGALGNAVGHSKHNKQVGTVVGAVLGGSIGADVARRNRQRHDELAYTNQETCRTVTDYREEERISGYRVTYRYAGELYTTRMNRDPGPTLPVRVHVSPA